jgi:hypothetical protein
MNRRDMKNMNDIFRVIMENTTGTVEPVASSSGEGGNLYHIGPDKLRENLYKASDSGETIVLFYTKKPSETENDILHCTTGPAVVFGNGGPENEFYFLNDKRLEIKNPDPAKNNPADEKLWRATSFSHETQQHTKELTGEEEVSTSKQMRGFL